MINNYPKYMLAMITALLICWSISCSGRSEKKDIRADETLPESVSEVFVKLIDIVTPEDNSEYITGEGIKVKIESVRREERIDSVTVFYDGIRLISLTESPWEYNIPSDIISATGRKSLKATAYSNGKARTTITRFVKVKSDIEPERYSYRVVNSYPHDREAFTQGLFYDNGLLYEGTGETNSSLREVELTTGKVIRQVNLDPSLFGEGITLYKEKIFQITWTSMVGFVYDLQTFRQLNKIYYQTQGWGLTTINDRIVMSDGTNVLYFIEPEMFTVVSRIEVYDNKGEVDQLNELEYIDGEIWANIWNTDLIARIDPGSGKVLAYINLSGILKDPVVNTNEDVLNGIAWDKDNGRIFVTGKNWPRLFEIRLVR